MATKFTEKKGDFLEGGKSNHMFGEQAAGPQKPAVTSHEVKGGAPGPTFAKGGSGKMFGYADAVPAKAGITGPR